MTRTGVGQRWRERAACLAMSTEVFFPLGMSGPALDQAGQAKAVCARCPVITQCLEWALAANQADGIWGGDLKTSAERGVHERVTQELGNRL